MQNKNFQLNLSKSYTKDVDGVERTIYRFIASTESIDRSGEVILLSAWDFSNYDKHPVILDSHKSWEIEHIVGKCVNKEVSETEFIIDVLFSESNAKGSLIEDMLAEGMPIATSVGFIPKERENRDGVTYITKAELLEVSMVVLPCNQDAVQIMKGLATKHNVDVKDLGVDDTAEVKTEETTDEPVIEEDTTPVVEEEKPAEVTEEPIKEETAETEEETKVDETVEEDVDSDTVEVEVEDEETVTIELEDENEVVGEFEVEISDEPVDNSETAPEKSVLLSKVEVKEGRKLSSETLAAISQTRAFAEDSIKSLQDLVATLDNLVSEAGDKTLSSDFITLSKSELKDLQTKVRGSDKFQDEALSIINKIFNK